MTENQALNLGRTYSLDNRHYFEYTGKNEPEMGAQEFAEAALRNYMDNAEARDEVALSDKEQQAFILGAGQAYRETPWTYVTSWRAEGSPEDITMLRIFDTGRFRSPQEAADHFNGLRDNFVRYGGEIVELSPLSFAKLNQHGQVFQVVEITQP